MDQGLGIKQPTYRHLSGGTKDILVLMTNAYFSPDKCRVFAIPVNRANTGENTVPWLDISVE